MVMTKYIPFLKSKPNEISALGELDPSILNQLTPFFDYPHKSGGESPDQFKTSVDKLVTKIIKHVSALKELYFDTFDISNDFNVDGNHYYHYLLTCFNKLNVIPVVSIDRSPNHLKSVFDLKSKGSLSSSIIAFRITLPDFSSFNVVEQDIKTQLGPIFAYFQAVDLIFDCRICTTLDPVKTSKQISDFAQKFTQAYPVRRLIVTGSSVPPSIGDILAVETECLLNRAEMAIFRAVKSAATNLEFIFGDYTTVSPNYSEPNIKPEMMQNVMTAKLTYSFGEMHYFIRGGQLKSKGPGQYVVMAAILCKKSFFRGAKYSKGDTYLEEKSRGIGSNCAPNTVIKPSVNAHITYIVRDASI